MGGLCKEVRDKLTTLNKNTFFSEWSNLHEERGLSSVSRNPIEKIKGVDLIFADTFHSLPPLAKIVCRQHFLGVHNVESLVFGTEDGKSRKESEILQMQLQRATFT